MIRFILVQNRQGKTRLSKFYVPYDDDEKIRLRGEVHRLIAPRDQKYQSNFVEVGSRSPFLTLLQLLADIGLFCGGLKVPQLQAGVSSVCGAVLLRMRGCKRQRAGVSRSHPPLCRGPRYVHSPPSFPFPNFKPQLTPTLTGADAFFGNVCELDLVFNFYKVYAILDEVFLAGEIEETSKHVVLARLDQRKPPRPPLPHPTFALD